MKNSPIVITQSDMKLSSRVLLTKLLEQFELTKVIEALLFVHQQNEQKAAEMFKILLGESAFVLGEVGYYINQKDDAFNLEKGELQSEIQLAAITCILQLVKEENLKSFCIMLLENGLMSNSFNGPIFGFGFNY